MTLRSGALPAGIKYLEERTVGAVARRRFDSFGSARGHLRHARRPYLYAGLLPLGGA